MLDFYNTTVDIKKSGVETALITIGSTEQHGAHLPISTDNLIGEAISIGIAKSLDVFRLPVLPISNCYEHRGTKGTVWVKPDTLYYVIRDMVLCLYGQGFKKIIVLISHGGVFIAGPVIRELNCLHKDLTVVKVDIVQFFSSKKVTDLLECKNNLHAGECETSIILYLRESAVIKDKIVDCIPEIPRDYLNYKPLPEYSPAGVWGKPSLASKEKGKKLLEAFISESISYITNTFEYLEKIDKN